MKRSIHLLAFCLCLGFTACASLNQGLQEGDEFATVVDTIGETLTDLEPAHIYEIDGEPVLHQRRSYQLAPGKHTIRVWPQGPAQRMVPDMELIEREQIQVDAITLEVAAGHRYFLGARRQKLRPIVEVSTEEGTQISRGQWQKTVLPVVVRVEPPVTWQRAAEGLSGFFGALLVGPVLLAP